MEKMYEQNVLAGNKHPDTTEKTHEIENFLIN